MATNFYDLFQPDITPSSYIRPFVPERPGSSAFHAFVKAAALSTAPTGGGVAAVPAGAEAGAGLGLLAGGGTPAEAFTVPVGSVLGGAAAALGGGWLIDKAQAGLIHAMPMTLQQQLGIDDASRVRDQAQHPIATFLGQNAPAFAFFRPSWGGIKQAITGGAINAGIQTGQDLANSGHVDWTHTGVAFGVGASLGHNTILGDAVQAPANWAIERTPTGAGRTQAEQGAADTIAEGLQGAGVAPASSDPVVQAEQLRDAVGTERLTPDEQAAIHVANDAALTRQTSPFQPGPAGDQEHGLRLAATMQAILAGTPLPPIGAEVAAHAADQAPVAAAADVKAAIAHNESRGSYTPPANPLSSATGKYQFTDGAWLGKDGKGGFAREVFPGKSDADLAALKSDPAAQEAVMDHALATYGRTLRAIGAPETPGNLYLLHFLGPRAIDVLRADAATPVEAILPDAFIRANRKWLQGKTAGELVRDMAARTGGSPTATTFAERAAAEPEATAQDPVLQQWADDNQASLAAEIERRNQVAADEAADNAPATEVRTRGPRQRSSPVDVATFLADRGGIADSEGHDLVQGRNLQQKVSGAGNLIRPSGMSVDAAGEYLWDSGYFGPPATTPRPTEAEVLDLLEQTKGGKIYHPEDAMRMADAAAAAQAARPPEHAEVRDYVAGKAQDMGLDLGDAELDHVTQQVVDGVPWDTAIHRTVDAAFDDANQDVAGELGHPAYDQEDPYAIPGAGDYHWPGADDLGHGPGGEPSGPDAGDAGEGGPGIVEPAGVERLAGEARADVNRLEAFIDPHGEGADAQIDSLEHDLRMAMAEDIALGEFRLDAEGGETTAAEALAALDADRAAWDHLDACLPAAGAGA